MNATLDMLRNSKRSHMITGIVIVSIFVSFVSLVFDMVIFLVHRYSFHPILHQNMNIVLSWIDAASGGYIFLSILIANAITYPFLFISAEDKSHERLVLVAGIYTTSHYLRIVLCVIIFQVL